MSLQKLEKEIKKCTKCSDIFDKYGIEAKPIFTLKGYLVKGKSDFEIMLVGQAPGISEYKFGKPFVGDAGKSIKKLFLDCGIENFDEKVYQTSVIKCFPGRKDGISTDRKPSKIEINNCSGFLVKQIEILKPKIIVCLGMVSWKALIELKEKEELGFILKSFNKKLSELKVPDIVGKSFKYKDFLVIPMIHPSGAANGVRSKNKELHLKSIEILRNSLK